MTGLIPRAFLDELLQRIDIVELISEHVSLKKAGNVFTACCPFHQEKTPSFNVIPKKQFYYCFGCNASGNAISFMMDYLRFGFVEAVESLAARINLPVPRDLNLKPSQTSADLTILLENITKFYHGQLNINNQNCPAIKYLNSRGLKQNMIDFYQLGYAPNAWRILEKNFQKQEENLLKTGMLIKNQDGNIYDRFRHRIMFPIHDIQGRVIAFGTRAIDLAQKPKYLNSPETILFQKNRELYGLYQVLQDNKTVPYIIVVEGYFDVITLREYGITNAVATLGTATTIEHIKRLTRYTKKIIFCFDGDTAGKNAAWRAIENTTSFLSSGVDITFVFLPKSHDPDTLIRLEGAQKFLMRINKALPWNQVFFSILQKDLSLNELAGKNQLVLSAKPYLNQISDGPYKELLLQELSRLTHIDTSRIEQWTKNIPTEDIGSQIKIRSPFYLAIALLLQNPYLHIICKDILQNINLETNQHNLFYIILERIFDNPEINTAALLETWRDSNLFQTFTELATYEHTIPESLIKEEFTDILYFLAKQNLENNINQLLKKARTEGLTNEEQQNLQILLQQKHQTLV